MTPIDKDAVLDAFAAETCRDRSTLERYIGEFPDLAEDLIDLSAELRLSAEFAKAEEGIISDPKLNTAWDNFLAAGPKLADTSTILNPFAQFKGPAFASLAMKLDIPRSILTAVRDRLVVPSSVPSGFLRRFSDATGITVDAVKTYLAQDSHTPLDLAFKSDQKPSQQGQVSFRHLVESTATSESQRLLLLRECEEHELP